MLKQLFFGLALSMVLFACQDESTIEEIPQKSSESLEDPVAYTVFHFQNLGAEIAKLTNDPDFRNLVYTEIDKKFDGDNNVLLETLSKELTTSSNGRVAGALSGNEKFLTSLEAFKDIEGENYYPQILSRFMKNLRKKVHHQMVE